MRCVFNVHKNKAPAPGKYRSDELPTIIPNNLEYINIVQCFKYSNNFIFVAQTRNNNMNKTNKMTRNLHNFFSSSR